MASGEGEEFNSGEESSNESLSGESEVEEGRGERDGLYGVEPYLFEPVPVVQANDNGEQEDIEADMEVEPVDRLGNTDWCTCGNCVQMESAEECKCCREYTQIHQKLQEVPTNINTCITEHPGFQTVCLDVWVLQAAYFAYRQRYGRRAMQGRLEDRYRYTAYRQLVRWCWGYLGREIRVPLPSCAVKRIRAQFPTATHYTGFQYAPLD